MGRKKPGKKTKAKRITVKDLQAKGGVKDPKGGIRSGEIIRLER